MADYDIIIIGGGISGLSMAHYAAASGMKALIVEKSDRIGGAIHSHSFGEDTDNFWIELGAQTCYNSYGNLIEIMENRGILGQIISRKKAPFKLLIDNEMKSIPSQLRFLELLRNAPRLFKLKKNNESIKSYYSKIVGRRNYDALFSRLFTAVLSQDASDFPADLLFKKRERRKDLLKSFTFSDGLQTITSSIAAEGQIDIVADREVSGVQFEDEQFLVTTKNGSIVAPNLALATPAAAAAKILLDAFPEVSEKLLRIDVKSVETVGVGVKKTDISLGPVSNVIPISGDDLFSIVSRDIVPDEHYRGFTFHFRPGQIDHRAKLKRIGEVLSIEPELLMHVVSKENLVPALKVGQDSLVGEIDKSIKGKRLFLTGNYFYGLAIEDCVSRSRREINRLSQFAKATSK